MLLWSVDGAEMYWILISSYRVGLKLGGRCMCERHAIMHSFSSVCSASIDGRLNTILFPCPWQMTPIKLFSRNTLPVRVSFAG
jgi:hypothetical protein